MATSDAGLKRCSYAGCKKIIPSNHFLCSEHYEDYDSGLIDQCPKCGRFKIIDYKQCLDCRFGRPVKNLSSPIKLPIKKDNIAIEHSKAWEKADKESTKFFVYILKLDNGKYYIGQSNDLRARLSEHKDGETLSTKGLNPKLQYFEILPNRDSVERREAELKGIYDKNPRQIRRMLIEFGDLFKELENE